MKRFGLLAVLTSLMVFASLSEGRQPQDSQQTVLRGWLSDEGCAGGRAQSGLYTGTNASCAKKCVREGKKIVFVDSDHKRLLTISNQDSATENVGDYVQIAGSLDEQAKTLQVTSLKLLEKGRAMCGVPKKKS